MVALIGIGRGKAASGTTTTVTGDTAFDSGPYDMWNQWQAEYEDLQQQISAQQGGQTSAGGGPPTPLPAPIPKPPIPTPAPRPRQPKPKPWPPVGVRTVKVKRGDSLSKIARSNHISMATLKRLNPVYWKNPKYRNGNRIFPGDKVRV